MSQELAKVWTADEIAEERRYYAGANGESFDYASSGPALANATPPNQMPYVVMISSIAQCESATDVCGRSYALYQDFAHEIAERG